MRSLAQRIRTYNTRIGTGFTAFGSYAHKRQVYQQCCNLINTNWNNKKVKNLNKGSTLNVVNI